jgi:hypothetical protein
MVIDGDGVSMFACAQSLRGCLRRLIRLAVPATLIATAGCALGTVVQSGQLAGACQMRACQCVSTDAVFGVTSDVKPVQWQDDGNAICPEGYRLRLVSR